MMIRSLTICLVVALGGAGSAWAQAAQQSPGSRADLLAGAPVALEMEALDADVMEHIVTLLSGFEYFPSADDLTAVTPDPVPYLLAIAYDTEGDYLPTHQHRAIGALAYFPTDVTRAHLDYLLTAPATPELMRHHVLNALANAFGDAALGELEPMLYADDLQLRLTAVSAIGAIRTDRSVEVLQSALSAGPHRLVQERIERELTTASSTVPSSLQ